MARKLERINWRSVWSTVVRCKCPFHDDKNQHAIRLFFPELHDLSLLRLWRAWRGDKAIRREFLASSK